MKEFYYIYQITNLVDGKIYVGAHQTNELNDSYMGSGLRIRRAIEKYGKENFKKDILEYFDSIEDMFQKEAEIVNSNFLLREDVYNLGLGGQGGSLFKGRHHSEETKEKLRQIKLGTKHSEETKEKLRRVQQSLSPEFRKERSRKGGSHKKSEEHRQKIREALSGRQRGSYERIICPYCKKEGGINAMKRWHFENCKYKL